MGIRHGARTLQPHEVSRVARGRHRRGQPSHTIHGGETSSCYAPGRLFGRQRRRGRDHVTVTPLCWDPGNGQWIDVAISLQPANHDVTMSQTVGCLTTRLFAQLAPLSKFAHYRFRRKPRADALTTLPFLPKSEEKVNIVIKRPNRAETIKIM